MTKQQRRIAELRRYLLKQWQKNAQEIIQWLEDQGK